jgi:alkanesulfonate monooxygenase SsuD/methylene tetrahydromethanopterin reductase-like flavin-dependent oxidoreductase (luciferase family)
MDVIVAPVQKPYPPLWYPAGSKEVAKKLGEQAINTVTRFENTADVRAIFDTYKDAWAQNQNDPTRLNAHVARPKLGLLRQIYVAESRERALREGKAAWDRHRDSFVYLWGKHGIAERAASLKDFDASTRNGGVLFGTPEEVAERLAEQLDATGANYVCANLSFGDLSAAQLETSLGLFAREVMPKLAR